MILDGEIVALDAAGRPSFNALQNRAQLKTAAEIAPGQRDTPVVLVCFDLLHFAGLNLGAAPYRDRRATWHSACCPPGTCAGACFRKRRAAVCRGLSQGFEGIIAKRLDSVYQAGRRSRAWLKIKAARSAEFVIGGYTRGQGAREPLGALLLGFWEGKSLRYAGHVGSGLNDEVIGALLQRAAKLKRRNSPFADPPPLHRPRTG